MKLYGRKEGVVREISGTCKSYCKTSDLQPAGYPRESPESGKQKQQPTEAVGGFHHLLAANKRLQRRLDEAILDIQALSLISAGK